MSPGAQEGEAAVQPEGSLSFRVADIRVQLKALGLPSTGRREQLWGRLQVLPPWIARPPPWIASSPVS